MVRSFVLDLGFDLVCVLRVGLFDLVVGCLWLVEFCFVVEFCVWMWVFCVWETLVLVLFVCVWLIW